MGCLSGVCGVSGSGKSTLVFEVLAKGNSDNIRYRVSGLDVFDDVALIEQSSITKMRRSNTATYSQVYNEIRNVFGSLPQANMKGMDAKHFSFNTPEGRCAHCEGLGYVNSNMLFLAMSISLVRYVEESDLMKMYYQSNTKAALSRMFWI